MYPSSVATNTSYLSKVPPTAYEAPAPVAESPPATTKPVAIARPAEFRCPKFELAGGPRGRHGSWPQHVPKTVL